MQWGEHSGKWQFSSSKFILHSNLGVCRNLMSRYFLLIRIFSTPRLLGAGCLVVVRALGWNLTLSFAADFLCDAEQGA